MSYLSLYVDLVPKEAKPKFIVIHKRRCGCRCTKCGARWYRTVGFKMMLSQELPMGTTRDDLVRGKLSKTDCPKCRGPVKFTNVCGHVC